MARRATVTLRDVAQLAGVSTATASKALNGKADVNAQTRRRVQEVADRLAFVPSSVAQAIYAGRTGTIGLLTHDLEGRFSLPILMGAEDAMGAGRMSIFLCDSRGDAIREQHHLRALLGRRVDGLIVVGSSTDPRSALDDDLPVPVVYAYAPSLDPASASVVPDNVRAGAIAVEHLVGSGRRRIVQIAGEHSYGAARDRVEGASTAMDAAGLSSVHPVRYGHWTEAWGRAATRSLCEDGVEFDALVCGSDQIARGALDALREAGRAVPEDVAVVGFDNWEPMVSGARPALTSIDMNFEKMGRRAVELVREALDGSEPSGTELVEPRVIPRGSTLG